MAAYDWCAHAGAWQDAGAACEQQQQQQQQQQHAPAAPQPPAVLGKRARSGASRSAYRGVSHHARTDRHESHIWLYGKQVRRGRGSRQDPPTPPFPSLVPPSPPHTHALCAAPPAALPGGLLHRGDGCCCLRPGSSAATRDRRPDQFPPGLVCTRVGRGGPGEEGGNVEGSKRVSGSRKRCPASGPPPATCIAGRHLPLTPPPASPSPLPRSTWTPWWPSCVGRPRHWPA
jgi:hypothetical protein